MKPLLIFLGVMVFISMVTANLNIGYDDSSQARVILEIPETPTNYSQINVNNSQFLRGYTPFNLPYLTSYSETDPVWTSEKGDYVPYSNANQDVDLGDNSLTTDFLNVSQSENAKGIEVEYDGVWGKIDVNGNYVDIDSSGGFFLRQAGSTITWFSSGTFGQLMYNKPISFGSAYQNATRFIKPNNNQFQIQERDDDGSWSVELEMNDSGNFDFMNNTIRNATYFGDGSQLTGIDFSETDTLQDVIDRDNDFDSVGLNGSGEINTTNTIRAEQLTSSDDIRANGLIYNPMKSSDATGLSITQSGYTGGLAVAMGSITGNQNTVASTLNADISGLSQIINNNHDLSGTMAMFFQTTTGLTNTARDNSQFPSGAQMAISVQTYGMKNIAKKTSSANIYATSMFGDPQFDTFGIQNDVSSTNIAFKGSSNYLNNLYGVYNYIHPASHSPTSPATTTTNSYGEYMHLSGRTTGTTAGYGLYINSVYGFDNGYGIWDNSGEDWVLDANEQMIRLGETQGNFDIFYNGSVPYFSTNSNGGFHFWNSTGYSELHVHNIVYHTHEPTSNNTLEGFTEDTELYDVYTEVEDLDNCTQVLENTNYIYMKNGSILILDYEIPEEHWDIINITNVTIERNYNTVCGTKLIKGKSGGQLVEDLQSMATKLNKNVDLYDNLTDFDTGIMAENLYTQSKVINLQDNYAIKFLNASWLDDKVTHKNKITLTQDDLPEDKRDVLSVEDRIVDLEGAFSDHMTCMYLHKKYEDYRDCMFDINPKDKIK